MVRDWGSLRSFDESFRAGQKENKQKRQERTDFKLVEKNDDEVQTQDAHEKRKLKPETKTRERPRWSTSQP